MIKRTRCVARWFASAKTGYPLPRLQTPLLAESPSAVLSIQANLSACISAAVSVSKWLLVYLTLSTLGVELSLDAFTRPALYEEMKNCHPRPSMYLDPVTVPKLAL